MAPQAIINKYTGHKKNQNIPKQNFIKIFEIDD